MAAVTDPAFAPGAELAAFGEAVSTCTRCALFAGRTQVVFGAGSPTAELMFVGEAPGFHEDKNGVPFVGEAGKLLGKLLAGIGLEREDVYIANVVKCLRYNAPIQLGDGTWERIGRLVSRRYDGTVMSVDDEGRLVPRRVVGWHATPLGGRRVFRLTHRRAKRVGAGRVGIELTGDHPVLTEHGYTPAQELRPTDRIATGHGLSDLEYDVVCGTLLGDGSINARSSYVQFSHSTRQQEYALFKAQLLAELGTTWTTHRVAAVAGGAATYGAVQIRTRAQRALRVLLGDFYGDRKRVPAGLADELNDRMLAIWFLDDGYTRLRSNRRPVAEIATNGFDDGDLQVLLRGLARLGLPAKTLRGRIYFDVPTTRLLCERIAPYTPPSMRYKLGPEVDAAVPFDPSRFEQGPRRVLYDDVEIEDVTDRPRTDTTFFCIDVEGTHNFVTSGGVVHNCRPPGNRDPQPEEIEACEGYLFRQIELIRPQVVATLGNFATKLLSGKPLGITRVHGQVQEVVLGGSRVTLYPLFHPAAALYTPRMLEVLEADFARLPDLLGRAAALVAPEPDPRLLVAERHAAAAGPPVQLGLF